jgi:hypothetical protein
MIGDGCQHVWLVPPAAFERGHWHKKYRIKCKKCEKTQTVDGSYAQRNLAMRTEEPEVAPKPTKSKRTPVEHDVSDKIEGWQGEYLLVDGNVMAAGFEDVKEGDTLVLPKGVRYVVRKFVVPRAKGYAWIAEIERTLL